LAVTVCGLTLALGGARPSFAATPSEFATMQQPISLASLPRTVLATRFCSDRVSMINKAGTVTRFADLPSTGNDCVARDVVVSPGLGGFRKNEVFVVQKQTIYRISSTGQQLRAFVTIGSLHNSETSLTFDTVGTFGFNLIATDRLGTVWRITSAGAATQVANLGHHIEGAQVAPMGFEPFGGQLLGTNDFTNSVFAVDVNGVETPVATYEQPESVEFIPTSVCEFANSRGALFVASQFGNVIYKFPASDFTGLTDGLHALVMTKTGKIGLLSTDGSSVSVTDFQSTGLIGELEDASFFPCQG
jgi:hypothetical protein